LVRPTQPWPQALILPRRPLIKVDLEAEAAPDAFASKEIWLRRKWQKFGNKGVRSN